MIISHHCVARDWQFTPTAQSSQKTTLSHASLTRRKMIKRGHYLRGRRIIASDFYRQGALSDRGQHFARPNQVADSVLQAQALQPGGGQDNCVVVTIVEF